MAFNRKEHKEIPEEKVIEINAQMEGTLTFADPVNLKIHGRYTGKLDTRGTLTIGQPHRWRPISSVRMSS